VLEHALSPLKKFCIGCAPWRTEWNGLCNWVACGYGGGALERTLWGAYQPGFVEVTTAGGISVGYEFDEVGNLKKLRAANQADPPKRLFGYDALNRLTEAKDGSTNAVLQGYAYDKTGNRTSATVSGATTAYAYLTGNHRLNTVGTAAARVYDTNGNTTSIPGTVVKNFVYGDHNRMTQYKEGTTLKMSYVYNGRGEQVRKVVGTTNTYSLYDEAGRWLGDYGNTGAAAPTQQVIWFGDLPVGVLVGAGAAQKLHYIEADALGTPRVVVDPTRGTNGTAVWTWDLAGEAFGTTAPNQNPDGDANQFVFNMRFAGQRYDAVSGLNQNGYRDYLASDGRYV
jgi:YD repeat-containing protein